MKIRCVWEHNGNDTILFADNFIGAFTRGASCKAAFEKMSNEVASYLRWCDKDVTVPLIPEIVQEKESDLNISDADSDVIFDVEREPLTKEEYLELKELALKSARDFLQLYNMVPEKDKTCLLQRKTFYGEIPRTSNEMYEHTKSVNSYYWGEIGVDINNSGSIVECRRNGFEILEKTDNYLDNKVYSGSYKEEWSLRKVLRRFIWHDRIHAKAMYKMAVKTFGIASVQNIFKFDL